MTKRKILVVVAIVFLVGLLTSPVGKDIVMAESSIRSGDYTYYTRDDGTIELSFYYGKDANVKIPTQLDGKTVTRLNAGMFYSKDFIISISIPSTITSINPGFTHDCSNLQNIYVDSANTAFTSVDGSLFSKDMKTFVSCPSKKESISIPTSITTIANCCFANCSKLTSIVVPDSVTKVGNQAFYYCSKLKSVTLSANQTSIEYSTFQGCSELRSIWIPDKVKSINTKAFADCNNLTAIFIPASVTSLSKDALLKCYSLVAIEVDSANTKYCSIDNVLYSKDMKILYRCSAMKAAISIPTTIEQIVSCAFQGCSNLTSITIPDSITVIPEYAFSGCSKVTRLSIPSGVVEIGDHAFEDCSSMTKVNIPAGVTELKPDSFTGCSSLLEINVNSANENYASVDGVVYNKSKNQVIRCPQGKESVTVLSGVRDIAEMAFEGCARLKSISLPVSLAYIQNYAFRGCTSLTTINIPKNVQYIGYSAIEPWTVIRCYVNSYAQQYAKENDLKYALVDVSGVKLNITSKTIYIGEKLQLKATISPTIALNKACTYSSSNSKVAKVDSNGNVIGVTAGTAKITVTTKEGAKKATCVVTVKPVKMKKLTLNVTSSTMANGAGLQLKVAKVTPTNTMNKAVTYKSSNTKVATVSTSGKVKAVGIGKCTITVTAKDGSKVTAKCSIKVVPKKVTSLKASKIKKTSFTLSWKKVSGVTGYKVYKYDAKTKTYKYYKTVKGTSTTISKLKKNTSYKFIVKSYVKKGNTTYTSSQSSTKKVKTAK